MNPIAISTGGTVIYWSAIIICLGVAAWFALSLSLNSAQGGKAAALWVMLPIAVILSVFFSRIIHWYCHPESYAGLGRALTDYSIGGYCLPGLLLGVFLAAIIVRKLRLTDDTARLLDAVAPGAALAIALIRLSALFNSSCRSTIIIRDQLFQRLPIGSGVATSSGGVEYRFATFFVQFLLMLVLALILVIFFYKRRDIPMKRGMAGGHVAMSFLVFYSAIELVLDSTRYDSSFLRLNGFVSIVQIVSALSILAVLIYYSCQSVKANGLRPYHWLLWLGFLIGVGGTGVFEYLVQRHGGWYKMCYSVMSLTSAIMAAMTYIMYLTVCEKDRR